MDKEINLFILTDCLNSLQGGAERQIFELVKHLSQKKFKLHVGCISHDNKALKELEKYDVKIYNFAVNRIYNFHGIHQGFRFKHLLKEEQIDVLISYHFGADMWGAMFGASAKVPLILSNRRDTGFWRNKMHLMAYRLVNRYIHKIIVVSNAVKDVVMNEEKVQEDKIQVIYNGIDLDRFVDGGLTLSRKKTLNVPDTAKIVCCVGNIRPVKGHKFLIKAARLVIDNVPEAHFIFIGGVLQGQNEFEKELKNLIEREGVKEYVHFLGRRTDIPEMLKLMDVCVLPSLSEGLSNTLLEYMAAGKAIVASRAGGNPEVIIDGESGLLFDTSNSGELAEQLIRLLKNKAECARLGEKAQFDVRNRFSIELMVKEYITLINNQMEQGLHH